MKKTKKTKETTDAPRRIYRDFTLDEFDDFTMEIRSDGAHEERGNIVIELQRLASQLREFSKAAELVPDRDLFAHRAAGFEMAVRTIQYMRKYEDNVGCPECEAF